MGAPSNESPSSIDCVLPPTSCEADIPACSIGELICAGPSVTHGYWNDEEFNAASFRGSWLRTNDLGFIDEGGFVHIVGRKWPRSTPAAKRYSPTKSSKCWPEWRECSRRMWWAYPI
ncbi:MAG: AMP-binding protein [Varibaculum cambriense]|uniref:AMP-dependent synthetase/ligase domain-containing protein n=1 Tax=Varibaculum cambriense TaxID=184870 RepID=A0ABX4UNI2_9ACTO|nr:AMP-binding protein [Varibaculum cambriense]MBS6620190.1 AMP-binding protein [Varibaculum cambriense]PMB88872.1 hypothetical protein CJ240_07575 [Varibaculum cambriense]